jgi:hypothetical protein
MHFREDGRDAFLKIFRDTHLQIRASNGCLNLELLQDASDASLFMTYSHWENAGSLENYRQSALFKKTWAATRVLFDQKPEAWSMEALDIGSRL